MCRASSPKQVWFVRQPLCSSALKSVDYSWIDQYILLALRMDRAFQSVDSSPFLDTYYGPSQLMHICESEEPRTFSALAEQAQSLLGQLEEEDFSPSRSQYLAKHVQSIETIARVRAGAEMPFFEIIEKILDIKPMWIAEAEFLEALAIIDQALPGRGDVRERFQRWQKQVAFPAGKKEELLETLKVILGEIRQRTRRMIELPANEELEVIPIEGASYGAANWYKGNYRSRMELNLDRPVYLFSLLYQMCHEAYPGHHAESCCKEMRLFRERGYLEQSVFFSLGPQLTIAEGIASLAMEMIFSPQEAAAWIEEYIFPFFGIRSRDFDLELILKAFTIVSPDDMSSNLAQLIEAGRSRESVLDYARTYSPYSQEQISSVLPWLESPLSRLYAFTYSHGKRLLKPLIYGPEKYSYIRKLLTEQVLPSELSRS